MAEMSNECGSALREREQASVRENQGAKRERGRKNREGGQEMLENGNRRVTPDVRCALARASFAGKAWRRRQQWLRCLPHFSDPMIPRFPFLPASLSPAAAAA